MQNVLAQNKSKQKLEPEARTLEPKDMQPSSSCYTTLQYPYRGPYCRNPTGTLKGSLKGSHRRQQAASTHGASAEALCNYFDGSTWCIVVESGFGCLDFLMFGSAFKGPYQNSSESILQYILLTSNHPVQFLPGESIIQVLLTQVCRPHVRSYSITYRHCRH